MGAGSPKGQGRHDTTLKSLGLDILKYHFCQILLGKVSSKASPDSRGGGRTYFTFRWEEDLVHKGMKSLLVVPFVNIYYTQTVMECVGAVLEYVDNITVSVKCNSCQKCQGLHVSSFTSKGKENFHSKRAKSCAHSRSINP